MTHQKMTQKNHLTQQQGMNTNTTHRKIIHITHRQKPYTQTNNQQEEEAEKNTKTNHIHNKHTINHNPTGKKYQ